jgi:trimeric autotransporter adhesin
VAPPSLHKRWPTLPARPPSPRRVTDTPSASQTGTPSPSQTGSASASATETGSPSRSGTPSSSQTGSASASATGTASPSVTPAPTSSDTGSASPPPSGTSTASGTKSPRPSLTATRTPPATASGTPPATPPATPPPTPSGTPSETPSQTGTPTPSLSPGASPSGTPPETPSGSLTGTPPETPTQTGTGSTSATGTPSTSQSRTPARSFTSSFTAAATCTPTPPGTPSLTSSLTPGGTSSGTATASPSASNTPAVIPDAAVVFGVALPGASCTDFVAYPALGAALRCALALAVPMPLDLVRLNGVTCTNGTVIAFSATDAVNTAVAPACADSSGSGRRRQLHLSAAGQASAAPLVAVSSLAELGPGRALVYRASDGGSGRRLSVGDGTTSADMTLVVPPPEGGSDSYTDATDAQQGVAGGLTAALNDMQSVGAPGESSPLGDALSASGFLDEFASATGTNPAGLADGVQLSDPVVDVPSTTMTPTQSATQTPSQSQTGTGSPSHTGTPSPSRTGTETRRFSDSGSPSRTETSTPTGTASRTGTPTQTPTATPSRTPRSPFACGSLLVAVVGDGSTGMGADTARPVWLFERARNGDPVQSFPLRSTTADGPAPACTLGVTVAGTTSLWRYDTDGLPSRSADGAVVVLPCFDIPAGDAMSMTTDKAIAVVAPSGTPAYVRVDVTTYYGSYTPTGFLQAATVDGTAFWLSGMSISQWGFRYLAPGALTSVSVLGESDGEPGYNDARGIAVFDGKLYGSTTPADGAAQAGVFQIGAAGLPTAATATWTMLPGVATPWTFAFENGTSLWASMDAVGYASGTLVHYVLSGGTWSVERTVQLDGTHPLYSVNGRWEDLTGANTGLSFVLYASSPARAYRYVPATNATSVVLDLAAVYADTTETAIRGIVPAPQAAGACSPTPTASLTSTPSSSATGTASASQTASNTGTPSHSQTGTPSASQTASNTGTPSSSQTGTPSQSQTATNTGTPSPSQTSTPSQTATETATGSQTSTRSRRSSSSSTQTESSSPTASSTGTASQSQTQTPSASETSSGTGSPSRTGTASQTQTGTPSSSQTGTASSTQTGTPSSTQTGTASPSQTGSSSASSTDTPSASLTGTPSASTTGTASQTQTGTPSASQTGTASSTQTGTPSQSQTASQTGTTTPTRTRRGSASGSSSQTTTGTASITPSPTGTRTSTPTPTATRTPASAFGCGSVVTLVVGDGSSGAVAANTARVVWVQERDSLTGALRQSFPLRATSAGEASPACTLGVPVAGTTSLWRYETDGLPSRSTDGAVIAVPCFDIPAGSTMTMESGKTIAVISATGAVTYAPLSASSYFSTFDVSGFFQAATVDGTAFWTAGMSAANSGFLYLPPATSTTVRVLGAVGQPGYYDARGVAVFDGKLYGASTSAGNAGFAGVFQIGAAGLPTAATATWTMLAGVKQPWAFVFESTTSLWVSVDHADYLPGTLVHYVYNAGTTSWDAGSSVRLHTSPVYSLTGRFEDLTGANTGLSFVLYGAAPTAAYRYVPATNVTSVVLDLATAYADTTETAIRGIVPAPQAAGACSPTPTASLTTTPSSSVTGTASQTQTGTPSSSQTGTPSHTQTGTPSASQTQTGTPSPSRTGTPSSSNTGTASSTQTGTPSASQTQTGTSSASQTASRTGTPSQTQTGTSSPSQTASVTALVTVTPSVTPSHTPASAFGCGSVVTIVVGDGSSGAAANTARVVWVQERDGLTGALRQSFPLRTWSTPSAPACTLGATTGGVADWSYETDGLPSRSADGAVIALPCFDIPAGGAMSLEGARKTVVAVGAFGSVTYLPVSADTYGGYVNNAGVRQVATLDGASFYLSGIGATNWGVRYLPPGATTTVSIIGMNDGEPTYYDARGVVVYDGKLFGSTSDADGGANAGVFQIGTGLPTVETPAWTKLAGVEAPWTFVFESPSALWVAASDASRPPCTLVRYALSATNSTWAAVASVRADPGCTSLFSLSGRWEDLTGANTGLSFVLYASNATTAWRYVPSTATKTVIANLAAEYADLSQTAIRGIVPAPQAAGACSPTPTASLTSTPSSSVTGTASQTQTGTPSSTQTGTSSASNTRTPSSSNTGTASSTQTGTPSASNTRTPSASNTGTASSTQTGTPSGTQTGTSSPSRTGTPSSSQTGTASQTQTGTPSSTQTGTPSASQTRECAAAALRPRVPECALRIGHPGPPSAEGSLIANTPSTSLAPPCAAHPLRFPCRHAVCQRHAYRQRVAVAYRQRVAKRDAQRECDPYCLEQRHPHGVLVSDAHAVVVTDAHAQRVADAHAIDVADAHRQLVADSDAVVLADP